MVTDGPLAPHAVVADAGVQIEPRVGHADVDPVPVPQDDAALDVGGVVEVRPVADGLSRSGRAGRPPGGILLVTACHLGGGIALAVDEADRVADQVLLDQLPVCVAHALGVVHQVVALNQRQEPHRLAQPLGHDLGGIAGVHSLVFLVIVRVEPGVADQDLAGLLGVLVLVGELVGPTQPAGFLAHQVVGLGLGVAAVAHLGRNLRVRMDGRLLGPLVTVGDQLLGHFFRFGILAKFLTHLDDLVAGEVDARKPAQRNCRRQGHLDLAVIISRRGALDVGGRVRVEVRHHQVRRQVGRGDDLDLADAAIGDPLALVLAALDDRAGMNREDLDLNPFDRAIDFDGLTRVAVLVARPYDLQGVLDDRAVGQPHLDVFGRLARVVSADEIDLRDRELIDQVDAVLDGRAPGDAPRAGVAVDGRLGHGHAVLAGALADQLQADAAALIDPGRIVGLDPLLDFPPVLFPGLGRDRPGRQGHNRRQENHQ